MSEDRKQKGLTVKQLIEAGTFANLPTRRKEVRHSFHAPCFRNMYGDIIEDTDMTEVFEENVIKNINHLP